MTIFNFAELIQRGSLIVNDGYRTKADELGTPGIPILRVAEVGDGTVEPVYGDHIREEYRHAIGAKLSRPGDVLLTTKGTVGRRAIVGAGLPELVYSPQLCFFRVTDKSVDARWLYYWLGGERFWAQAGGVSTQTDMAPYISLRDLRAIKIDLLPIEEQLSIATTLGTLDAKIASNSRAMSLIEQFLHALFAWNFDISPVHDGVPLSDLVTVNGKRILPKGSLSTYVGMASLPDHSASVFEWSSKPFGSGQKFVNGDVLMARITPCLENGKTAIVDMLRPDEVGWGSTEYVVLSPRDHTSTAWIYCLVRTESVRSFAIRSMSGTSGRQRFQASDLSKYLIAPPTEESLVDFNRVANPDLSSRPC